MKKIFLFTLFITLNFLALAIGGLSTSKEVFSDWYLNLNKAPWTPPGWVFGFAWTIVMITFSFFITGFISTLESGKRMKWVFLYVLQWFLNVIWNPVFFSWHYMYLSLLVILFLFALLLIMLKQSFLIKSSFRYFIIPYVFWLCIAISLNAYAVLFN